MENKRVNPFDEDMARVYEIYKALEHLLTDEDRKMFKKYNSLPENEKRRMNNRLRELIDQIPGDYDTDLIGDGLTTREYVKDIMFNGMSDFEDDFGSPNLTDKQYDDLINSYRGIKTESTNKYIKSFREAVEKLEEYHNEIYDRDMIEQGTYAVSSEYLTDLAEMLNNLQATDQNVQKQLKQAAQSMNTIASYQKQLEIQEWKKSQQNKPSNLRKGRHIDLD
jgi:hypothetical protein